MSRLAAYWLRAYTYSTMFGDEGVKCWSMHGKILLKQMCM